MSIELTALAYATMLLLALVLIEASVGIRAQGFIPLIKSRDNLPPPTGFHARAKRCVDNHREGLTIFAPLALVAASAHVSNGTTVLGAQLFLYSRIAHAVLYLSGVPLLRSLAWGIGIGGTIRVFAGLMGGL